MFFRLPPPAPPKRYHVASTDEYASFFLLLRSCHVTITVEWYVVPPLQSLPRGEYSGAAFCSDLRRSQHATRVESKDGFWNVVPNPPWDPPGRVWNAVPKSTLGPQRRILGRRYNIRFKQPKVDFGTPFQNPLLWSPKRSFERRSKIHSRARKTSFGR